MAPSNAARRSGLFRRIYVTFVVTVVGAALAAAGGTWFFADQASQRWVGDALELLGDEHDVLVQALDQPAALDAKVEHLSHELSAVISVYELASGRRLAGEGPAIAPRRARRLALRLARGQPVFQRPPGNRATVHVPLVDVRSGEPRAVVIVTPRQDRWLSPLAGSALITLALLGLGAWSLSRSFTRRLARLERSAERIAGGDLSHRVALTPGPPQDEIDDLGEAFNRMADRVQTLLVGQQSLLANVSHELRTPIARIKVLLELLEDRVELLSRSITESGQNHLDRLQKGIADMARDTREIEALITDLLTSGRLELRLGEGGGLDLRDVDVPELCRRMGDRFAAIVEGPEALHFRGDDMLLERLLSNLLSNARRACPEGDLHISIRTDPETVTIAVEDEGEGIPVEKREAIFEPFTRLDAARSRDRGGVGLGLYLCRQIARAHGGDVQAESRGDGRSGARMVVRLSRHLG